MKSYDSVKSSIVILPYGFPFFEILCSTLVTIPAAYNTDFPFKLLFSLMSLKLTLHKFSISKEYLFKGCPETYKPRISFSIFNFSISEKGSISGIDGCIIWLPLDTPKSDVCLVYFSF